MHSKVHHFPWSIRKYLSYSLYILVLKHTDQWALPKLRIEKYDCGDFIFLFLFKVQP